MKAKHRLQALVILLALLLSGCNSVPASTSPNNTEGNAEDTTYIEDNSSDTVPAVTVSKTEDTTNTEPTIVQPEKDEYGFTEQQRNSFSMLYYLSITAEKIRISKDNRLILDDIYTSLLNDINPGAIDEPTQDHLERLRDIIKSYISISIKRDRLQYIYNQNKASAIRSAVPNPLAILSATNSFNWKQFAISAVYTFVDSYNNYKSANEAVDQEYLMSGWELDDDEMATIQRNREQAFDYMVDIVQEYHLDGKLTLNERAIETFAEICAIESVQQKTRRLESEEATYKLLGNYWLELADCYYTTAQYQNCLECIEKYNALATGIYRKDYNYVQILPKVIVAAQETYSGDEYVSIVSAFADAIIDNTTTDEWSVRYFAAQVYLDLYTKTSDQKYLENAYNIAYDNVTILLDEQIALNAIYLADVQEETITEPDYRYMTDSEKKEAEQAFKAEEKRLKAYNKSLKNKRETELPALYEPLILNCDLLFALANELNISDKEKAEIESILQTNNNGVFLSQPINHRYSFFAQEPEYGVELTKEKIMIPVTILTDTSVILVSITDQGLTETFSDCIISKVVRAEDDINSFCAHITSNQLKKHKWTKDSKITVTITNDIVSDPLTFNFKVSEYKDNFLIGDKVVFETE